MEELLSDNRIWKERTVAVGILSAQQAWDWGCSGPMLRASGIDWDLRKTQPYDAYNKMNFNIPLAGHGDCYDRYLVSRAVSSSGTWQFVTDAMKLFSTSGVCSYMQVSLACKYSCPCRVCRAFMFM